MMSRKIQVLFVTLVIIGVIVRITFSQSAVLPVNTLLTDQVKITQAPKLQRTQQQLRAKSTTKNLHEFIIYTSRYPSYRQGDILQIDSKIRKNHIISRPKIKFLRNDLNPVQASLTSLRDRFQSGIQQVVPEPHASLVLGMLLGFESDTPPGLEENLKRTGTIHMLVVSGFNITLVSALVMRLAGIVHRKYALLLAITSAWLFVSLTGGQPPALRAGVMATLALTAQYFGRPTQSLYLLILSALLLVLISPDLLTSLSFQLSCAATAGIILLPELISQFTSRVEDRIRKIAKVNTIEPSKTKPSYLSAEINTTLAAQIAVTPLIINSFGSLSLIAPLTNILVAWTIPYIMIAGLLIGIAGLISKVLSQVIVLVLIPFTAYFLNSINITASYPFAYYENIKTNLALSAGIYLILIYVIAKKYKDKKYSKEKE